MKEEGDILIFYTPVGRDGNITRIAWHVFEQKIVNRDYWYTKIKAKEKCTLLLIL